MPLPLFKSRIVSTSNPTSMTIVFAFAWGGWLFAGACLIAFVLILIHATNDSRPAPNRTFNLDERSVNKAFPTADPVHQFMNRVFGEFTTDTSKITRFQFGEQAIDGVPLAFANMKLRQVEEAHGNMIRFDALPDHFLDRALVREVVFDESFREKYTLFPGRICKSPDGPGMRGMYIGSDGNITPFFRLMTEILGPNDYLAVIQRTIPAPNLVRHASNAS